MKVDNNLTAAGVLNVFSLGAISFTWAHFLNLISIYWLPLTVFLYVLGYTCETVGNKYGRFTNNNR